MRRFDLTVEERNERAAARIEEYVDDKASESTTRAALLALGFSFDDIEHRLDMAAVEWNRRQIMKGPSADSKIFQDSLRWLDQYFATTRADHSKE